MTYRFYFAILALLFAFTAGGLLVGSAWLEPFSGDLTRVGGLSEASYGWRDAQLRFPMSTYVESPELPATGERWDVVVFGDSFSDPDREAPSWLHFLVAETGLKALVVRYRSVDQIRAYLESEAFSGHPPRVVIVESVTRNMVYRLAEPSCAAEGRPVTGNPLRLAGAPAVPGGAQRHFRRTAFTGPIERLNTSSHAIRKSLTFAAVPPLSPVRSYELGRSDLFSSVRSTALLYYVSDSEGQRAPDEQVRRFVCTLVSFDHLARAGGAKRFLFLPAVDKSVAYAPYAATPSSFDVPVGYELLRDRLGSDFVDSLSTLRAAIAAGGRDVYLPDDSHWGSNGARVVAASIARALEDPAPTPGLTE